jgi:DNA helicase-2/ATP-dependent DNA helicase PcrA
LKQAIYEYETTAGEETSLESYLQDIALLTSADRTEADESIKLMTVHAAKGLEFPCVFVCGLSEGIFPSQETYSAKQLEEERRLAYVAFTRAEDMLFLSDSEGANFDGSFRYPSRFIFDSEQVEYLVPLRSDLVETTLRFAANHERNIDTPLLLPVGSKVIHEFFGNGEILDIDENQSSYLISFDSVATPRAIRFNTALTGIG